MKHRLLILFLFATSLGGHCQVNAYFLNDPEWGLTSACAEGGPDCIRHESYNYYINGDTAIGTFVYKKFFRQGNYYYFSPPPSSCTGSGSYVDPNPSFFCRSAGKKIFVREASPADTTERLLYDFNLVVGDTLPLTANNYQSDIVVTAIDSVYTPYGYRKRFAISNSWSSYLVEGIGHDRGLFEPLNLPLECGYNLVCYSLNDSAWYPSTGPSCDVSAAVIDQEEQIGVSVFPNPSSGIFDIVLDIYVNDLKIRLLTLEGQVVLECASSGSSFTVDLSKYSSGTYFLELNTNGVAARKILLKN
jgi:hypothetical protein